MAMVSKLRRKCSESPDSPESQEDVWNSYGVESISLQLGNKLRRVISSEVRGTWGWIREDELSKGTLQEWNRGPYCQKSKTRAAGRCRI